MLVSIRSASQTATSPSFFSPLKIASMSATPSPVPAARWRPHEGLVRDVAALAARLAEDFGHPVDIEWAHDGTRFYVLQCRPITALPVQLELVIPEGSWQKDTTHYPKPVSPLFASHLHIEAEAAARRMERLGFILERLNEITPGGEVHTQPIPVGGRSGKPPPPLIIGLVARIHAGLWPRMATAKRLVTSGALEDAPRRWRDLWEAGDDRGRRSAPRRRPLLPRR